MSESWNHSNILTFQHSNIIKRFFAGGHRGEGIPVPIPNTEVKLSIAEGSASRGRARVGRCRLFLFFTVVKNKKSLPAIAARIAAIVPALFIFYSSEK